MSYAKFTGDVNTYLIWRKQNNLPVQQYEKIDEIVRDRWISEGRYAELISFILENWDSGNCEDFMQPLVEKLIRQKEVGNYKKLWKGVIRHRLEKLWDRYVSFQASYPDITVDAIAKIKTSDRYLFVPFENRLAEVAFYRHYSLIGISAFIAGLKLLDQTEEIQNATILFNIVSSLERPSIKRAADKRKIDEELFWQLIEQTREISADKFEFIDNLKITLESFSVREIRNFDKQFQLKFNELNKWEIWALAYIVRRGCGDDAFDYFKAWVISKGQAAFSIVKQMEEEKLSNLFDEDPQLEELIYTAQEVYESKASDFMAPVRIKLQKMTGKRWQEDNLTKEFPALCALFGFTG